MKIDKQIYVSLGNMFRTAREDKGLSLEEVGKHLGLTKKTIQRYELAESRISDKSFEKLTELLDLDIEISINNNKELQTEFIEVGNSKVNINEIAAIGVTKDFFGTTKKGKKVWFASLHIALKGGLTFTPYRDFFEDVEKTFDEIDKLISIKENTTAENSDVYELDKSKSIRFVQFHEE